MCTSLRAILLVTNSSRGPRFVFHYPKNPKRREENDSLLIKEHSTADENEVFSDSDIFICPCGSTDDIDKRSLREESIDTEFAKQGLQNSMGDDSCNEGIPTEATLFGFEPGFLADI